MRSAERRHKEFLDMLRQNEGTLLKVCLCFTDRRRDDIRDLYQEIVCTLWEAWPDFKGDSAVSTWVTRIALNVAGQDVRRSRRLPGFLTVDDTLYDTLAEEASDQLYQRLYQLIDLLDDDDRKLIFLYLDRKRFREIAEITGSNEAAVKQKLYRLKQKLNILNQQKP